jgi:hypothetical protein
MSRLIPAGLGVCLSLSLTSFALASTQAQNDGLDAMARSIENGTPHAPPPLTRKWIAFSISRRSLHNECGDGKYGVGISSSQQQAIVQAANICEANTSKQGSCSSAGSYPACRTDKQDSWTAFAIFDNGYDKTEDGEAIAFPDKLSAGNNAWRDCHVGLGQCNVVFNEETPCPR